VVEVKLCALYPLFGRIAVAAARGDESAMAEQRDQLLRVLATGHPD
jgi:hypothetical protein